MSLEGQESKVSSDNGDQRVILDVRSPGEFNHAHIPGAFNLPLFSDEERAEVGTLYKQVSADKAFKRGLEIAGAKMSSYVSDAETLAPKRKIMVHCWRGGKRSESMAWLLQQAGFDTQVLAGGYKKYRNSLFTYLAESTFKLCVIAGKTGSGKTALLEKLRLQGEQVIDLEALASHKGSAFGSLGMASQPGTEQFENNLFAILKELNRDKIIFIEDESKMIGTCHIPHDFYLKSRQYGRILLDTPLEDRIKRLVADYGAFSPQDLAARFRIIETRLGNLQMRKAIEYVESGNYEEAVAIALGFYDKAYSYQMNADKFPREYTVNTANKSLDAVAQEIINHCKTKDWTLGRP